MSKNNMSKIELSINNRKFDFMCPEGAEDHLKKLAENLNNRIDKIAKNMQISSDSHIIAMAAILAEDELEALKKSNDLQNITKNSTSQNSVDIDDAINKALFETLEPVVNYLEKLTKSLENS